MSSVHTGPGWVVGIACAVIVNALLARGLARRGSLGLGPADRVTLVRAMLACGVAGMVADSFAQPAAVPGAVPAEAPALVPALVALTVIAIVLDAVDGWVARRTGTVTALGARFDMEVDAFLILVLSLYVARSAGLWVLAIGAARYAFLVAGRMRPWLRGSLPPRYWGKVVAATQGVVLTVAAAGVLSDVWTQVLLIASLALLTESFGRQVWGLWQHRSELKPDQPELDSPAPLPDAVPLSLSVALPVSTRTEREISDAA